MTTTTAITYSGTKIQVNKKTYRKAVKACAMNGQGIPVTNEIKTHNNDQTVKYLLAKRKAFEHRLHNANLYSMKIIGRQAFVI